MCRMVILGLQCSKSDRVWQSELFVQTERPENAHSDVILGLRSRYLVVLRDKTAVIGPGAFSP